MHGFLDDVAQYLLQNHTKDDLQDALIIMPSKRGGIYLKKALARVFPKPFFSPTIYSLEEFVLLATESELIAQTDLLLEAYTCFKAVDPQLVLEKFMGWGPIMLKDFDTIDMYLVPPKDLFNYLSEAKSIDRWAEELVADKDVEMLTPNTQAYFKLHENLLEVYGRLQSRLNDQKKFYRGQLFRKLVEQLRQGKKLPLKFSKLYFLGFNALSKSEEEIIRQLILQENAEILWDADHYYLDNPLHRAGFWLRNYADKNTKNYLANGDFLWKNSYYQESDKKVDIVKVKNNSTQVFWALEKILDWERIHGIEEDIALVLADEQLLSLFLDYLGYFRDRLNITMGYPVRKTAIFHLIEDIWEFYLSKSQGYFEPFLEEKVLNNPLLSPYKNKEEVTHLFLWQGELSFQEILKKLSSLCYYLIKWLPEKEMPEQIEAIFLVRETIDKLSNSFKDFDIQDLKVGRSFLRQLLSGLKISFEGQVKRTLNVMGLLETRTLDFDRVIVLSVNEEILPRNSSRDSLIPYDIATLKAFDLPTRTQADAVTSYHFHRLLQRPKEIILVSVLPAESGGAKEESRFIQQLRLDWPKLNPHLIWNEYTVNSKEEVPTALKENLVIDKTTDIHDRLIQYFQNRGISPSSFENLMTCELKFYWSNVLGIREDKKEEDEIGSSSLGTWIHKVLEMTTKELIEQGQSFSKEKYISQISTIEIYLKNALKEIEKEYGEFVVDRGFNFIMAEITKQSLVNYFQYAAKSAEFSQPILSEATLNFTKDLILNGKTVPVLFTGNVDLIDFINQELRILDYKTGEVKNSDLIFSDVDELFSGQYKPKVYQLIQYYFLLEEELNKPDCREELKPFAQKNLQISPGIISTRRVSSGIFKINTEILAAGKDRFFKNIEYKLTKFLDKENPIQGINNYDKCKNCSFEKICHK